MSCDRKRENIGNLKRTRSGRRIFGKYGRGKGGRGLMEEEQEQ